MTHRLDRKTYLGERCEHDSECDKDITGTVKCSHGICACSSPLIASRDLLACISGQYTPVINHIRYTIL